MMIRQRMVSAPEPPPSGGYSEPYYEQPVHRGYNGAAAYSEREPPLAPEVDIPADPDGGEPTLDQLMEAAPSLADSAPPRPSARFQRPRYPQRPQQSRNANVVPISPVYTGGAFGAFSLTKPLGLSENVQRSNMVGDGAANVKRDAYRHFGFAGSRRQ
jgi:hypothetical protein